MVRVRRTERYTVGQGAEGVIITMHQNREALSFAAAAAAALAVSWWLGPDGTGRIPQFEGWFYALWTALLLVCVVLGLVGSLYRQRWVISSSSNEIIVTDTFGIGRHRVPREERLRLHLDASGAAVGGAVFPYEVEIEDRAGQPIVPAFLFSTSTGAEDFIEALRILTPVDTDLPKPYGPLRTDPSPRR